MDKHFRGNKVSDKIEKTATDIADLLKQNGEMQKRQITKLLHLKAHELRTALLAATYMYPIYESDNSQVLGILDRR